MDDENEDGAFDAAAVKAIATKMCNNILLNQPFVHAKVPIWSSTIIENVLKELAVINDEAAKKNLQKFKYIGEPPLLAAAIRLRRLSACAALSLTLVSSASCLQSTARCSSGPAPR